MKYEREVPGKFRMSDTLLAGTMQFAGLRCLVTGGLGFVGSHLCERLIKEGSYVTCLDNLSTGSFTNLKHLVGDSRLRIVEHDVIDPYSFEVDAIFNLACPASPDRYQEDPIKTLRTNFIGASNALELARRRAIPVLQASTSEVYGDPQVHPQPESYWGHVNPIGLRACYDEGKRSAEALFFEFKRQHGLDIKIARIFNTYGPRMAAGDGRVVSNFVNQALQGTDLTIYGDGSQTRSFCYVDDLVEGLLRLMASGPRCADPVNLGNPEEITIAELARKVIRRSNKTIGIAYRPAPPDDPKLRQPDISRAVNLLGWHPTTQLDVGLEHMFHYFAAQGKVKMA